MEVDKKIEQMRGMGVNVQIQTQSKEAAHLSTILQKKARLEKDEADRVAREALGEKKNQTLIVNGEELKTEDFAYQLAYSLQLLESETDPLNEYYTWLDTSTRVTKEMTDGEVTLDDLYDRNSFLGELDQRESDMKAVISIYRGSNYEGAKKQLAFLEYKWQRLMELRNAVKNNTSNEVTSSREATEAEKVNGQAVVVILKNLGKQEAKRWNNGDYSLDDEGVFAHQRYGFSITLVENRLMWQYGFAGGVRLQSAFADQLVQRRENSIPDSEKTLEATARRIEILRGRLSPEQGLSRQILEGRDRFMSGNSTFSIDRFKKIMQKQNQVDVV